MKNKLIPFFVSVLALTICLSCKKDPSILKIYVRSNNFVLTPDATVRIVGDISEDTPEYFKETRSDASGVATFNLDELFDSYGKDQQKVAVFTVYARDSSMYYSTTKVRAKANQTTTESITLEE